MITRAEGTFRLDSEAATTHLGAAIGTALAAREAVCLYGPLGVGKSVLARALVRFLCPAESDVPSPSYTLAQFYCGQAFPLAHFDLFRTTRSDEAFEIGLDEALEEGAAVIEWADRLGRHLPPDRLEVELAFAGAGRRAVLTPVGTWQGRPIDL